MESKFDSILATLSNQSAELNRASDQANRTLAEIERRLVGLNIGLEVWYPKPLTSTDEEETGGPDGTSTSVVQLLGFARVDGEWCLAVKPMRRVSGFYQGDQDNPYTNPYADGPAVPLLKQSRALRIAALRAMPRFLTRFNEQISTTVRDIEDATNEVLGSGRDQESQASVTPFPSGPRSPSKR